MEPPTPHQPDPTGKGEKYRYTCPAGHHSWQRTNNHVYCHGCARDLAHNPDEADPEWHYLIDQKTSREVSFRELKQDWPPLGEVRAY